MNTVNILNSSEKNVTMMDDYMVKYIDEFLQEYSKRSSASYENYKCDINKFARDMFGYDGYKYIKKSDLENLTVDILIQYFNACFQEEDVFGKRKYSNQTINRRMSSLKSLIKYLSARGKIDFPVHNMMVLLKPLPKTYVGSEVFSHEDAKKVLNYFKELPYGKGNVIYLMSKLSLDTGLRASELLSLTWKQFRKRGSNVTVRSLGEIKGKGNKDWKVDISLKMYEELLQLKSDEVEKVFDISYSHVARLMTEVIEDLNLKDRKYTFHSFRKRAVTNAYDATKDIRYAKKVARHNSIATTQIYLDEVEGGAMGYFSKGNDYDSALYKEVDTSTLIEALESLGENFIHTLNMKLNEIQLSKQ